MMLTTITMGEKKGLLFCPDNTLLCTLLHSTTQKKPLNADINDDVCVNRLTMYNRILGAKSLATQLSQPGSTGIIGLGLLLLLSSWIPFII